MKTLKQILQGELNNPNELGNSLLGRAQRDNMLEVFSDILDIETQEQIDEVYLVIETEFKTSKYYSLLKKELSNKIIELTNFNN